MKNYLIYPFKTMNISQGYDESYTHKRHNTGTPKDYPFDEAGADSGRDYFYCPCDEVVIKHIYGVGTSGTNTVWIESTSKVIMPYGEDYVTILITHSNDSDLEQFKTGQKFKRGEAMFREGTDGQATGNHLHVSIGTGSFTGSGWVENSNDAWVLKTTGTTLKPEQAFYIDKSFTTIKNSKNLEFKLLPVEIEVDATNINKTYEVTGTGATLNVRSGPGTEYSIIGSYEDGDIVNATKLSGNWVYADNKGWCSIDYLKEIIKETEPISISKYFVIAGTGSVLNIRAGAGTDYERIGYYSENTLVFATKENNGWMYVDNKGWCIGDYLKEVVLGDVDMDGVVSSEDARLILRASFGLEDFNDIQKIVADLDRDGKITPEDAKRALMISADIE